MTKEIKTWFVVSDIHSFYVEFKEALKSAGFDKKNKTHGLIVCGDIFDRGPDSLSVYRFLKSLPKYRCILVKGNHESLYKELLTKTFPDNYDFSNGTVRAFCNIADIDEEKLSRYYWLEQDLSLDYEQIEERLYSTWNYVREVVAKHEITAWLDSKQWVNYYELDKYIFVHSFIPLKIKDEWKDTHPFKLRSFCYDYNPDWRNATNTEWEEARWGDPIDQYLQGLFDKEIEKGKVLVVGHWHTSDFYWRISRIKSYDSPIHNIWYGKGLIALDGGVFRTAYGSYYHPQNVLVIDTSDFNTCYDQEGNILEPIKTVPIIETVTITGGKNND